MEKGFTTQLTNSVINSPVGFLADIPHRREIYFHHYGNDHEPNQNGNWNIDMGSFSEVQASERLYGTGSPFP